MKLDFNDTSFDIDALAMICHSSNEKIFVTTYIHGENKTLKETFRDDRSLDGIWAIFKDHEHWLKKWNFLFNTECISRLDYNKKDKKITLYLTNGTITNISNTSRENYIELRDDIDRIKSRYLLPLKPKNASKNKPV